MKKCLSLLLALMLLAGLVPANALAAGKLTITKTIPGVTGVEDEFVIELSATSLPAILPYTVNGSPSTIEISEDYRYLLKLKADDVAVIDLAALGEGWGPAIYSAKEILDSDSIYTADQTEIFIVDENGFEDSFYSSSADQTLAFVNRINLATATVKLRDDSRESWPYNSKDQQPEVVVNVNGIVIPAGDYDVLWYREGDRSTPVIPHDAGKYIGVVQARDNSSCISTARQTVSFEITPAPVTISTHDLNRLVGDSAITADDVAISVGGLFVPDELASVKVSCNPDMSRAGKYAITLSDAVFKTGKASNYHITYTGAYLNVTLPTYTRARFLDVKADGALLNMEELDTVDEIKAALKLEVLAEDGYTAENILYHDMIVEYSYDQVNWYPFTISNFPADGVWVRMDYPSGTAKNTHDFRIVHMFAHSSERLNVTAGDTEIPEEEQRDDGIWFLVRSMSPVAVGRRTTASEGGSAEPGSDSGASDLNVPQTGDSTPLWPLAVLCAASFGVIVLMVRRRKHA